MSSCPTAATSTSGSSISCPSQSESASAIPAPPARPGVPIAVIACGALGASIRQITARRGWHVELHLLPALLHNRPRKIAPAAERLARRLQSRGHYVVLAYADCGTYGALDDVCERLGIRRLGGLHCYDVFAGPDTVRALFAADPGTYVLTDFLVRSFRRTVLSELGLDRHPELWGDYFGHYSRIVWLAQRPSSALEAEAQGVAELFGLPLAVLVVGVSALEVELEELFSGAPAAAAAGRAVPAEAAGRSLPGVERRYRCAVD